jgi:glycogenin glucosyltransferase
MVTPQTGTEARHALERLYDHVVPVEPIFIPHARRQQRQDRPFYFTRLNALRLGRDGDLGLAFEKVVLLDADVLPLRAYDELMDLAAPAGILNERKSHMVQLGPDNRFHVDPADCRRGEWHWHRLYGQVCPHGRPIPAAITDRVAADPTNMGINGGLLVIEPSMRELASIIKDVRRPEIARLVGDRFDWPDMQYLTMRWSGRWTNIDVRFAGLCGYPCLRLLKGVHYAGVKPWSIGRGLGDERAARHPDIQHWLAGWVDLMRRHPSLGSIPRLRRLRDAAQRHLSRGPSPCPRGLPERQCPWVARRDVRAPRAQSSHVSLSRSALVQPSSA